MMRYIPVVGDSVRLLVSPNCLGVLSEIREGENGTEAVLRSVEGWGLVVTFLDFTEYVPHEERERWERTRRKRYLERKAG
jgi:hypothetical protein